jgi:murein DD-endopeptidase MepM/ murein hydrolase activator NlpD
MGIWNKLRATARKQYKVQVINTESYEERANFDIKVGRVWLILGSSILGIVIATTLLIALTPVREWIPGYMDTELKLLLNQSHATIQELKEQNEKLKAQFASIQNISAFKTEEGEKPVASPPHQIAAKIEKSAPAPAPIAQEAKSTVATSTKAEPGINTSEQTSYSPMPAFQLFQPVSGRLTRKFDAALQHYAVDISASENELVKAVADGSVFIADFTFGTGYTIGIYHTNGLVSVYKHNQRLLKSPGAFVKAGESIAVAGNSGEMSSGPHLHFELWWKAKPVDPTLFLGYALK